MEKKLIECFLGFSVLDLIGFGKILGVEENGQEFEDFVTEIVVEFSKQNRFQRSKLLKLAKKIKKDNSRHSEN